MLLGETTSSNARVMKATSASWSRTSPGTSRVASAHQASVDRKLCASRLNGHCDQAGSAKRRSRRGRLGERLAVHSRRGGGRPEAEPRHRDRRALKELEALAGRRREMERPVGPGLGDRDRRDSLQSRGREGRAIAGRGCESSAGRSPPAAGLAGNAGPSRDRAGAPTAPPRRPGPSPRPSNSRSSAGGAHPASKLSSLGGAVGSALHRMEE